MTREEIQRIAEKHCTMTAGWIFSYPDIEEFWNKAYAAGAAAEREACAETASCFVNGGQEIAAAIRARGEA